MKCKTCDTEIDDGPMNQKIRDLIIKYYGEPIKNDDSESYKQTLNVIDNWIMTHQVATRMKHKSIEILIHYIVDRYDLTENGKLDIEHYIKLVNEIEKLIPELKE